MSNGELTSLALHGISSPFASAAARPEPATTGRLSDRDATLLHQRLGARLRLARRLTGLSQTEAGRLLGVTFQQYQKYEAGQNRLSAVALHRLAAHFGVSTEWFHAGAEQEPDARGTYSKLLGPEAAILFARFRAIRDPDDRQLLLVLATRLASGSDAKESQQRRLASAGPGKDTEDQATPVASDEGAATALELRHILLVDDDRNALVVASAFLRKAGFAVATAASGDEALQVLAMAAPVDVLITDHAMPGLSGLDLVELALERRPSMPALVITGYGRDVELGRLQGRVRVLAKPFTRDEFVACVRGLIGVACMGPRAGA